MYGRPLLPQEFLQRTMARYDIDGDGMMNRGEVRALMRDLAKGKRMMHEGLSGG